jgi:hypothetical protein
VLAESALVSQWFCATIGPMSRVGLGVGLSFLSACSFLTAAGKGSEEVHRRHEYIDLGGMLAAEAVCLVGVVAWQSPDAFAPVQDDPTSWAPGDRASTVAKGETAATLGCTSAVLFMASAIYGRHFANENDGDEGAPSFDPGLAAMGGAFAGGFLAAQRQTSSACSDEVVGRTCKSDFNCGIGYTCVKANYAYEGRCAQVVDSTGVPTFNAPDPDSVGPKMPDPHDCDFDTDCPVGFRCEPKSGACFK